MFVYGSLCLLRPPRADDVDFVWQCENDRTNWRVSQTTKPYTRKQIERSILNQSDFAISGQLRCIVCSHTGSRIGIIDAYEYNPEKALAWLGILIAKPSFRQRGMATDALSLFVSYLFEVFAITEFGARIFPDNLPSIRLFEKAGFTRIESTHEMLIYRKLMTA